MSRISNFKVLSAIAFISASLVAGSASAFPVDKAYACQLYYWSSFSAGAIFYNAAGGGTTRDISAAQRYSSSRSCSVRCRPVADSCTYVSGIKSCNGIKKSCIVVKR